MRNIIFIFMALSLASCAFAPMNSSKTARPISQDTTFVDFGFSPFPYANISQGISDRFTASGSIEQQLFPLASASIKYSFSDKKEGMSIATELGGSLGMGAVKSYSGFGGPILSWKRKKIELYLYPKFNYVSFDKLNLSSSDRDNLFVTDIDPDSITYLLTALGTTYWFKEMLGVNLEIKHFTILSKPGKVKKNIIPSIGLIIGFD